MLLGFLVALFQSTTGCIEPNRSIIADGSNAQDVTTTDVDDRRDTVGPDDLVEPPPDLDQPPPDVVVPPGEVTSDGVEPPNDVTPDGVEPPGDIVTQDVPGPDDVNVPPDAVVTPSLVHVSDMTMSYFVGQPLREDLVARFQAPFPEGFDQWGFRLQVRTGSLDQWHTIAETRADRNGFIRAGAGSRVVVTESEPMLEARLMTDEDVEISIGFSLKAAVIRDLATGGSHSCVTTTDGELFCWGDNGPADTGDDVVSARPLTDAHPAGRITRPVLVPTPGLVSAVSVAGTYPGINNQLRATTCIAVATGDNAGTYCTGWNTSGGLGNGGSADHLGQWVRVMKGGETPQALPAAVHLVGGGGFTCAAVPTSANVDSVWCWGHNDSGQLGGSLADYSTLATAVVVGAELGSGALIQVKGLAAGKAHGCAQVVKRGAGAQEGGDIFQTLCWGANRFGQLGRVNETLSRALPGPFPEPIPLLCPEFGRPQASEILTGHYSIRGPAAGYTHTCGIMDFSTFTDQQRLDLWNTCHINLQTSYVVCAGNNGLGQAGQVQASGQPAFLTSSAGAPILGFEQLVAGNFFTCGLDGAGTVQCWGDNTAGQLGAPQAQLESSSVPRAAVDFPPFLIGTLSLPAKVNRLAASLGHVCAVVGANITIDHISRVYCWGASDEGAAGGIPSCEFDTASDSDMCGHQRRRMELR